jgi:hypothetical protein
MDAVNRTGQVWMAQIGVERFPFVVLELRGTTWIVQNLGRVGQSEDTGTIKASQFGVEEGVFVEFEKRTAEPKGLQRGELIYLSAISSLLRERIT